MIIDNLVNLLVPCIHFIFEKLVLLQLIDKKLHFALSWPFALFWRADELLEYVEIELALSDNLHSSSDSIQVLLQDATVLVILVKLIKVGGPFGRRSVPIA